MSRLDLQASSGLVTQVRSLRWAIVQTLQAYPLQRRVLHGALVRRERSAVKVARCVLRGERSREAPDLPGGIKIYQDRDEYASTCRTRDSESTYKLGSWTN